MNIIPLKRTRSQVDSSMDDRDATRSQVTMPSDDATNAHWTKRTFDAIPSSFPTTDLQDYHLIWLLSTIVSKSEGRLNTKYVDPANAQALVEEHPELQERLRVAWKDKTIKEISSLRAFAFCSLFYPASV
jgi:hypothetical protein